MTEPTNKHSKAITRRSFLRTAFATATAIHLANHPAAAAERTKVKFYKNFAGGHIGVSANQRQSLEYAVKYGFEGIAPNPGEFMNKSADEINEWLAAMKDKGIRYGSAGLPVEFRRDQDSFEKGLAQLPKQAKVLNQLGVTRMATWILPGHNELTYLQNFERHKNRLRKAAEILRDNDIRLGLEFVGPRTSRSRSRYPFICTQAGMMELANAIGTPNTGLLLDSWHWYTSHGTVDELLQLTNSNIVHVHVNDAPSGVPIDQQADNRRKLPATTGVIDLKGFINALVKIGYDGPIECEPFDQDLRKMQPNDALKQTIEALNRLWSLIST